MTCDCCHRARLSPAYPLFCPACLHCGARLIQAVGRLPIGRQEASTRRRKVLADWMAHGHPEQQIRNLADSDVMAIAPLELAPPPLPKTGQVQSTASARPTPAKRR
jgi:hypothetical protein